MTKIILRLKRGFTLMELMVVIIVISILVGLLVPAVLRAKEGAREKKARTEVFEIQKAWAMYYQYYYDKDPGFRLPNYGEMDATATSDLGGGNPDSIVFMEFTEDELLDGFLDPWKQTYKLEFTPPDDVVTEWEYRTRVQCMNASRGKY